MHLSEQSANNLNQTELVALIINMGSTFVEGINMVYRKIKGSCSMLILTEDGIIAARDVLGRTPIVIGKKETHQLSPIGTDDCVKAHAVSSETTSFPNLDYKPVRDLGPGEIVRLKDCTPQGRWFRGTAASLQALSDLLVPVGLLRIPRFQL